MTDEPIDFTRLDPTADPASFDAIVGSITARAAGELARRRARAGVLGQITRWTRPMLAAAAVLALVSLVTLARVRAPETAVTAEAVGSGNGAAPVDLAEAIGIPGPMASWVRGDAVPDAADLLGAFQGDM